ncbi:MAG: hypothetical protein ACSHWZ_17925 [Sulfitobacter sp.]
MTKKFLFLGTSYLGAIQQGWNQTDTSYSGAFIGFNAPALTQHLERGWSVEGSILNIGFSAFTAGLGAVPKLTKTDKDSFSELAAQDSIKVDLTHYSHIVFVDMFFRPLTRVALNRSGHPEIGKVPASKEMILETEIPGFMGNMHLKDHPIRGTIPNRSSVPLMEQVCRHAPAASVALIASPRPPVSNTPKRNDYSDLRKSFDFLDELYSEKMNSIGISYLRTPRELLDNHGSLTPNHFSRGPHRNDPKKLDGHMNAEYGVLFVKHILKWSEQADGQ